MSPITQSLHERLYKLLDPEKIQDDLARRGSEYLGGLDPADTLQIFESLVVDRVVMPEELSTQLSAGDAELQRALHAALRRLCLVGLPLANEIKVMNRSDQVSRPAGDLEFGPETDFDVAWAQADGGGSVDAISDMELLARLQKKRLKSMVRQVAQLKGGAFLSSNAINDTIESLRKVQETLVRMKIQMGIIEEQPKTVDVRLQAVGQTMLGGLQIADRESMDRFAERLVERLEEKYGAQETKSC